MTGKPERLGALGYKLEGAFGESTNTYDVRLEFIGAALDLSGINQELIPRNPLVQRPSEDAPHILGPKSWTLNVRMMLYAHKTATTGALTHTPLSTLLGILVGNASNAEVGVASITSGTTTSITAAAATGLVNGIWRVGVLGDGRADGQAAVMSSASSPFSLLTALPGAPNAGDALHAMLLVYPPENTPIITQTIRLWAATANKQYWLRGGCLAGLGITIGTGEVPMIELALMGADWSEANETFPSVTATNDGAAAIVAGGSTFVQAKGTTTRQTVVARDPVLTLDYEVAPVTGSNSGGAYRTTHGYRRIRHTPMLEFSVMSDDVSALDDLWDADPLTATNTQILMTLSTSPGSSLALSMPNCIRVGRRPIQTPAGGINYQRLAFKGVTNTTTTNELTLAPWVLGLA